MNIYFQDCVPEIEDTVEDENKDDEEVDLCEFFTSFEDPNQRNGWECKDGSKCVNGFNHNGEACDTLCASTGFNIYGQECVPELDDKDDDKVDEEGEECVFFTAFEDPL